MAQPGSVVCPELPKDTAGPLSITRLSPHPPAAPGHWLAGLEQSPPSRRPWAEHLQWEDSHEGQGTLRELSHSLALGVMVTLRPSSLKALRTNPGRCERTFR